jgi:hypothetical protein
MDPFAGLNIRLDCHCFVLSLIRVSIIVASGPDDRSQFINIGGVELLLFTSPTRTSAASRVRARERCFRVLALE